MAYACVFYRTHRLLSTDPDTGNDNIKDFFNLCERKSQCCRQMERLGVQSYVMKIFFSICYAQPANTVNMLLRSS
jgi:hypothetical protein